MNSFIAWVGGKKALRKNIIARFPKESIEKYVEVFGGAGWVLFGKKQGKEMEIFNDANGNLINLYRCVKFHCEELQRELQWGLYSKEQFQTSKEELKLSGLTDIQRAAKYFILIRESYGASLGNFSAKKRNLDKMIADLKEIHIRLNKVVIENEDFELIINRYDSKDTFFYFDPPYYGTEQLYYDITFTKDDHKRLNQCLERIKGKFLLSYNDCEYIRELYKDFIIEPVERQNNLTHRLGKTNSYKELIITNYKIVENE